MLLSIQIMLPEFTINARDLYFKGYLSFSNRNTLTVFVTKIVTNDELLTKKTFKKEIIYGKCTVLSKNSRESVLFPNYIVLHCRQVPRVHKLIINGKQIRTDYNCIILLYNYDMIKNSETICESYKIFTKLQCMVRNESRQSKANTTSEQVIENPYWLSSSMFGRNLLNYANLMYWLINSIKRDKKVSIKQGNLIFAILIDIILGYLILKLLTVDKKELSLLLMTILEKLVNSLYSLLKWLMGAPAGLKLNNAFNKMLGKYFSYHIQLWWLFLEVSGEKLDVILHIYHYLGYLGFTFQAAIIADMICITTFHSYCIYVYVARLFNIQISGLKALLRLFVGRKYNPLRNGIDSCEYTNQELFVGTVAFTVLLLLLPTTTMYYIVFTLFRVLSLAVQYTLAKIIYMIQTLPLYVVTLWSLRSSKVAGNIIIEVVESKTTLVLRVKLCTKSVHSLINNFKPPVRIPKQFEWTNLFSNVFSGKQII